MIEPYETLWFPEIKTSTKHKASLIATRKTFQKAKALVNKAISEGIKNPLEYEKWKKANK